MEALKTTGKVVDGIVILGSAAVGIGAVIGIASGIKAKKYGAIAISSLTLLIGIYAIQSAAKKINA